MSVQIVDYDWPDADESRETIDSIYGTDAPVRWTGAAAAFRFRMRTATAGVLGADQVRLTADALALVDTPGMFVGLVGTGGAMQLTLGHQYLDQTRDVVACYPSDPFHIQMMDVGVETVRRRGGHPAAYPVRDVAVSP